MAPVPVASVPLQTAPQIVVWDDPSETPVSDFSPVASEALAPIVSDLSDFSADDDGMSADDDAKTVTTTIDTSGLRQRSVAHSTSASPATDPSTPTLSTIQSESSITPSQSASQQTNSQLSSAIHNSHPSLYHAGTDAVVNGLRHKHSFVTTTYGRPTYCDLCRQFIWGLVKQGDQCKACGYNAHHKCHPLVKTPCNPVRYMNDNGHKLPLSPLSVDASSLLGTINAGGAPVAKTHTTASATIADAHAAESPSTAVHDVTRDDIAQATATVSQNSNGSPVSVKAVSSTTTTAPTATNMVMLSPPSTSVLSWNRSRTPSPSPQTSMAVSLAAELISNVQIEAKKTEQAIKDANPPFGVNAMIKSNTRYVARQGPLIWINDTVTSITTWQNPTNTLCFLLSYVIVCSYPILILIIPQAILGYIILKSYIDRAEKIVHGEPIPAAPPLGTPPKIVMSNTQYIANLQHIQNTMTNISNMYDSGYYLYQRLNWSDPHETERVMYMLGASVFGMLVLGAFVPLNIILMWAGILGFLANTAIVRAAGTTFTPMIVGNLQRSVDHLVDKIKTARSGKTKETVVVVTVFENQRWWAGFGFVPVLLRAERTAWSDESGQISLPPKEMYQLPSSTEFVCEDDATGREVHVQQVWEWIDKEWTLDTTWTSSSSLSSLVSNGWIYTDNFWSNATPNPLLSSYTRRRKWIRRMRMLQ